MVSSEGNAPSPPAHTYFASEAYSQVRGLSLSPDPAVTDGAATLRSMNRNPVTAHPPTLARKHRNALRVAPSCAGKRASPTSVPIRWICILSHSDVSHATTSDLRETLYRLESKHGRRKDWRL
jgi:hypothetical protein